MDENEAYSTSEQSILLFKSFFDNCFDYLKIFIPLLIIYKLYLKYSHKFSSKYYHLNPF
jgi:hypothetical protein